MNNEYGRVTYCLYFLSIIMPSNYDKQHVYQTYELRNELRDLKRKMSETHGKFPVRVRDQRPCLITAGTSAFNRPFSEPCCCSSGVAVMETCCAVKKPLADQVHETVINIFPDSLITVATCLERTERFFYKLPCHIYFSFISPYH